MILSLLNNTLFVNCRLYLRWTEPVKNSTCNVCRVFYIAWVALNFLGCKFSVTQDDYFIAKTCRAAPVDFTFSVLKLGIMAGTGELTISYFNQAKILNSGFENETELNDSIEKLKIYIRLLIYL